MTTFEKGRIKAFQAYKGHLIDELGRPLPASTPSTSAPAAAASGGGASGTTAKPTPAATAPFRRTTNMKRYGEVGHSMNVLSRDFKVSVRLPATCTVTRVQVVRNTALEKRFDRYCAGLQRAGIAFNIGVGYHGTSEAGVVGITDSGFISPAEVNGKLEHKSGNNGWYGDGIYTSPDPNIAFWYSQGNKMLVCKVARGRVYSCPGMMLGAPLQPGFDSHESPDTAEWVAYASAQVLPIAIIHFESAQRSSTTVLTKATIRGRAAASVRAELDAKASGGFVHVTNKERKSYNRVQGAQSGQALRRAKKAT